MTLQKRSRHFGLDLLRMIACYMVIQIHTGEFFYIASDGKVIPGDNAYWVGWYNSLFRSCVPLFVMITGYFLFPVGNTKTFFSKRFARVLIPFVVWCILYALRGWALGQTDMETALINIAHIPVNYGTEVGHLWFVYMLIGIYLFAPVISPWIETASKQNMMLYLGLWAFALSVPYTHLVFPSILGEAFWNGTPLFYYFNGFLGYALLAAFIRRFYMQKEKWNISLGVLLIVVGYAITAGGFLHRLSTETYVMKLELTWGFETINVAMMAAGLFLVFKNAGDRVSTSAAGRIVSDISLKSYGIYLAHIMLLNAWFPLISPHIASAAVAIPLIAFVTFVSTYLLIKLLSYLPKSKYITG